MLGGSGLIVDKEENGLAMTKISVLLVDDHEVVRQGLRALLTAEEDMEVAAKRWMAGKRSHWPVKLRLM